MARGQQKIEAQQKANEKAAKLKKQQGNSKADNLKTSTAKLSPCVVCRSMMPDPKTYKQHFEAKHPKNTMPEDLKDVQT